MEELGRINAQSDKIKTEEAKINIFFSLIEKDKKLSCSQEIK